MTTSLNLATIRVWPAVAVVPVLRAVGRGLLIVMTAMFGVGGGARRVRAGMATPATIAISLASRPPGRSRIIPFLQKKTIKL